MKTSVDACLASGSPRQCMLDLAVRVIARAGRDAVAVCTVAEQTDVEVKEAKKLFASDEQLADEAKAYLDKLVIHYLDEQEKYLSPDATALDRMRAMATGFFEFAQKHPVYFDAFTFTQAAPSLHSYELSFDDYLQRSGKRPTLDVLLNIARDCIEEAGGPRDADLVRIQAVSLLVGVHGISHLCTTGVLRHLSPTAKKQTFNACLDYLSAGLAVGFAHGAIPPQDPVAMGGSLPADKRIRAKDLPRGNDGEVVRALLRGAVEDIVDSGLSNMHLGTAAERAGIDFDRATHLIEGDQKLLSLLEKHIDAIAHEHLREQMRYAGGKSLGFSTMKACAFGYLGFAHHDPVGFLGLTMITSGSIVPASFERKDLINSRFEMGETFGYFMTIARDALDEAGGPRTPWALYTMVMSMWSTIHGFAHLTTFGALRDQPREFLFDLASRIFDIELVGIAEHLGIKGQIQGL
ncbi:MULTISPECIES: TetR-like C-terminal domain-containing protein [Corynebacterium]|nr:MULTISPECIES: TetR-like C-terminal domain-containing protein [Corynebacterium]